MHNTPTNETETHSFSKEQQRVFELVVTQRKNVFFTGSAGTGKSFLLQKIITALKTRHRPSSVAITATTGISAVDIGVTTLHYFAGIGIGREPQEKLLSNIIKSNAASERWQAVCHLIIDEISMLDAELFDKLEWLARQLKKNPAPFGGIQLILAGDFSQLPPVMKNSRFCFEADTWSTCVAYTVQLKKIFRQRDMDFIEFLNEVRFGELSEKSMALANELNKKPVYPDDGIRPTLLFPKNDMVNTANILELNKIPNKSYVYKAMDWELPYQGQLEILRKGCLAPEKLKIKRGAQVMLIKNLSRELVNGSRGVVVGFYEAVSQTNMYNGEDEHPVIRPLLKGKKLLPIVRFTNSQERVITEAEWKLTSLDETLLASRRQLPLILAWAISIHKSQGQTIERLKVDLNDVFEKGQTYVALSRAISSKTIQVIGFSKDKVRCHPKVKKFYESLTENE
ncbi:unnamed protein product [Rhizophagus irregularis]|uniref:ATP-dependent DNA helicase PIF1 n=1 Tax=Rhizophagus irregularis TaxID=588596 RepID=A0A915ZQK0_9GLOM|nr:unnamed protein product [Rhizophagus irregularis]